jgi:hypothetical protein
MNAILERGFQRSNITEPSGTLSNGFLPQAGVTCREQLFLGLHVNPQNPAPDLKMLFPNGFQHDDVAVSTINYANLLRDSWELDQPNPRVTPDPKEFEEALVDFRITAEDVLLTRSTTEVSRRESDNSDAEKIVFFFEELTFRLRGQTRLVEGIGGLGGRVVYPHGITTDKKIASTRADRSRMQRSYEYARKLKLLTPTERASIHKIGWMFEVFPGEHID